MTIAATDELYMRRCFNLALKAGKKVKGNPRVGAILVYRGRIIGEGCHEESGGPHAEVNCLRSVSKNDQSYISEGILYISLEPCCHHGKTPPCTDLILNAGIKDVRISVTDPSDKVKGKGIEILRKHGVTVKEGILEEEGQEVIRPFAIRQQYRRPFIILKVVKSKDNFIGQPGKKIWMTSPVTDVLTHKWRSEVDAIMVGTNTVINDRPSLTTRNYPGDHPVKLVIDRHHKVSVLKHPSLSGDFMYFTYHYRDDLPHTNQFILNPQNELESILHNLNKADIHTVMIEGGSSIIKSWYDAGIWDEARIVNTSMKMESGVKAVNIEGRLLKKYASGDDEVLIIARKEG